MNLPSLARMFPTEKRTPGHLMKTRAFRGWWPIRTGLFMVLITIAAGCGSGSSSSRLANIVVSPSAASVIINGTQQFTATAMDANGNPQSSVAFTWSSTANGVATVNTNGIATGISVGATGITATADGVTSLPATLTVGSPPPPSLAGNWGITIPVTAPAGFLGATTAGLALGTSTLCGQLGLSASTSCYQAQEYPIEWVRGICTGNNGTNPYVDAFVIGQSKYQVTFYLHARVPVSALGSPPPFEVIGTGTISGSGEQLQMTGTWAVSDPTNACSFTSGTWSGLVVK